MPVDSKPIKKSVIIDLEINPSSSEKNPFQKIIFFALAIDAWRIFPRLFLGVYILLLYNSVTWFMGIENPSVSQASLISVITGLGLGWFMAYVNSGNKNENK